KRPTRAELRARITEALVRDVGVSERMAEPFVESILGCFAGERQYFPASERAYPVMQIRAALERGALPKAVCREFSISRSLLHRLFPGGLPRKRAEQLKELNKRLD
ncbi:MAG TPA: hypothetical protein VEY92_06900, partial [Pseudoxanthomonas sp.]|nr:hypothetical protein [Pseudoxanthomonas sp.]